MVAAAAAVVAHRARSLTSLDLPLARYLTVFVCVRLHGGYRSIRFAVCVCAPLHYHYFALLADHYFGLAHIRCASN